MSEEEQATVAVMVELFRWESDTVHLYQALSILRKARGEAFPSWDEFRAGQHG